MAITANPVATVRDVAARAGVSVTTVSHVINGTRRVSDNTKANVERAIRALSYRSNLLARGLRSRRTSTLGMVMPDISNPFFSEIGRAIEDIGYKLGYSVVLCDSYGSIQREINYVNVLLAKRVDGLLVISTGDNAKVLDLAERGGVPIVVVDRDVNRPTVDTVLLDNKLGGALAARHLLGLGHRRVACIAGPSDVASNAQRVAGFLGAIHQCRHACCVKIVRGDFNFQRAARATNELLKDGRQFTAIFATNDIMAVAAIAVLRRAGIDVPIDVSIVGFDNIPIVNEMYPAVTTIGQPVKDLANAAVTALLARVSDHSRRPSRVVLKPVLVTRESTAACQRPTKRKRIISGVT